MEQNQTSNSNLQRERLENIYNEIEELNQRNNQSHIQVDYEDNS